MSRLPTVARCVNHSAESSSLQAIEGEEKRGLPHPRAVERGQKKRGLSRVRSVEYEVEEKRWEKLFLHSVLCRVLG